MQRERTVGLWIAVVTGMLTVLGTVIGTTIKGIADIRLERAKLDSQLILNALAPSSIEERRASLRFLVQANLIDDEETKQGLRQYFEGATPKDPPQLRPFIESGATQPLVPQSPAVARKTDVDLFVCGRDTASPRAEAMVAAMSRALKDSGGFGASNLKVWDGGLYQEIPLAELDGRTTIVVDQGHPEQTEVPRLRQTLSAVPDLPPVSVVPNRGSDTEWRISIVLCPGTP